MAGSYGGFATGTAAYDPVVGQSSFSGTFPYSIITEIAFASNPLDDATAVWTDVSRYVGSIQTNRGRQHELGRFEAGTATVTLKNYSGQFSPFNTSGPYYPNVVPYKQIRIRALYNGVYYPIFRGHIQSWPIHWDSAAASGVTVHAVDATKMLNLKKAASLNTSYASTVTANSPSVYYRLGEAPGTTTVADSSGNSRTGTINTQTAVTGNRAWTFGQAGAIVADTNTGLDCGSEVACVSLTGLSFDARNCTVEMWVQTTVAGNDCFQINDGANKSLTMLVTSDGNLFVFASDGTNSASFTAAAHLCDGKWHHVAVVVSGTGATITAYVDGVTLNNANASPGSLTISGLTQLGVGGSAAGVPTWDGVIDEFALYPSALSSATLQAHYQAGALPLQNQLTGTRIGALLDAIGWPSSLRSLDAGLITLQAASNDVLNNTALANIQATCDTEQGDLFISAAGAVVFYDHTHKYKTPNGLPAATLGDSGTIGPGGESPYLLDSVDIQYDDLDIYNEAAVTPAGQGAQVASDSTSQTTYGKRTTSVSGLHALNVDAANQANWLVGKYKSPLQRIRSVTFTPMSDPTVLLPAALGFELLTRINLKRRPKDASSSTFSQDSLIEGISLNITNGYIECTWALSPTDAAPVMWIIGDPVAGLIVDGATQSPPVAIGF